MANLNFIANIVPWINTLITNSMNIWTFELSPSHMPPIIFDFDALEKTLSNSQAREKSGDLPKTEMLMILTSSLSLSDHKLRQQLRASLCPLMLAIHWQRLWSSLVSSRRLLEHVPSFKAIIVSFNTRPKSFPIQERHSRLDICRRLSLLKVNNCLVDQTRVSAEANLSENSQAISLAWMPSRSPRLTGGSLQVVVMVRINLLTTFGGDQHCH